MNYTVLLLISMNPCFYTKKSLQDSVNPACIAIIAINKISPISLWDLVHTMFNQEKKNVIYTPSATVLNILLTTWCIIKSTFLNKSKNKTLWNHPYKSWKHSICRNLFQERGKTGSYYHYCTIKAPWRTAFKNYPFKMLLVIRTCVDA